MKQYSINPFKFGFTIGLENEKNNQVYINYDAIAAIHPVDCDTIDAKFMHKMYNTCRFYSMDDLLKYEATRQFYFEIILNTGTSIKIGADNMISANFKMFIPSGYSLMNFLHGKCSLLNFLFGRLVFENTKAFNNWINNYSIEETDYIKYLNCLRDTIIENIQKHKTTTKNDFV